MSIGTLIARLQGLDVKIVLDGDDLRVNAPAGVLNSALRAELSSRREELRTFLRSAKEGCIAVPELIPMNRRDSLPVSYGQERFLFLHQMEPTSSAYVITIVLRLTGPLRIDLLRRAWSAEVARQEVLRTTFNFESAPPLARLGPAHGSFDEEEVEGSSEAERLTRARRRAFAAGSESFDVESGPIARLKLFKYGESQHLLLINMHHAVSDQWSLRIIMRDLASLYNAYVDGREPVLPTLPVQYADFADWQRRHLEGGAWNRQLTYWRAQLSGVRVLDLPTDHPRPAIQGTSGETLVRAFPDGLVERIQALASDSAATAPMVFLSAFLTLIYRYTGQRDLVVGQPVGGRQHPAVENLVGLFLNTVALRVQIEGDPTFLELLEGVKQVALDAYSNQDFPFERIIAELSPARDTSRSPLVQVVFNVVNAPIGCSMFDGIEWEPLTPDRSASQLDLSFIVDPEIVKCAGVQYNTDLFDAPRIERMLQHYEQLLLSALADPTRRISELAMLTTTEHDALVHAWNATESNYPADQTLVHLFEEQTRRTPDALAASCGGVSLSYAELDRRASRLASHLRTLGVRPNTLVGVSLERSVDMLVSVLGVLKSGAAYVPLDPAFPAARLSYMIEDSGLGILITQESLAERWNDSKITRVVIDVERDTIDAEVPSDSSVQNSLNDLAYVIYTSGSTGKPKGVQIPHGALINFLRSMQTRPGFGADDVMLAVTTLSFDIAGLELYLPLISGGTVVIATRDEAIDGAALLQLIASHGVTVLQATPATFRLLVEAGWQPTPQLRVLCGGEPMPTELADVMGTRAGAVWNMYGPTETTIWSTIDRVEAGQPITIGQPIANTKVYVLDGYQNPLPVGVPGELYIAGDGLARGYLRRPDLTAEKFLPDPFSSVPGARMYRTGDLARFLEDGRIECLGRVDHQVKIRGYRIETGEIETALTALPTVRQAAVVARPDGSGIPQLVAYVVADLGATERTRHWREALKEILPDYMVPGIFVCLETLPLTANGKVDRSALPEPDSVTRNSESGAHRPPESDLEKNIARIWQTLLTGVRVGLHDNFFDLGGHSLLLAQVRPPLQELVARPISMVELFQYPTVAALAKHLSKPTATQRGLEDLRERARQQRRAVGERSTVSMAGGNRS